MPLEQLEGRAADARSDQWSFCASLYEAVYGERPFAAEAAGSLTLEMMRGRVRPASKGARVPRRLRRALVRGLAKDPDARWPTMDALATELGAIEGARRTWWTAAAGAMLLGGLGLVGELGERASHAEPVLAEGNEVAAAPEDGHSPSPAALALREQAEDDVAADRPDALNARLDRIEPQQLDDDPALAAEVLLWRARLMADGEDAAAALRRAHAIALQADMPSIESRAAGAMAGNMQGAHAEGVAEWMRLAWVAVERTPEDRSAAIEVAVTAAHSAALTWELAGDTGGARELLAFADAVVGDVEPDDDAYVAALLVQLAAAWESIDEPERALHWARRARALLGAVAGPDHAQWAKASEQIGRALMLSTIHGLNEALAHLDEAQAGYLARGNGMGAAVVGLEIARCLSSLDRHEAALDELRRVGEFWAAQDPVFMVHRQQAHLVAAEILLELGRRKEAAAEYERILALVDLNASDQKYRDRARQALDELRSAGPPGKRER
jgi:tetratricopeptide (TPR) repeat protein